MNLSRPVRLVCLALPLGLFFSQAVDAASLADAHSFDDCDALVRDRPEWLEAYRCYWMLARRTGQAEEAVRRLETLLGLEPENHRALLYLAAIESDRRSERSEELARKASDLATEVGDARAEAWGRMSLAFLLRLQRRLGQSRAEIDRVLELARESGDEELVSYSLSAEGWQCYGEQNYAGAYRAFRELEVRVFPEGSSHLQGLCLSGLGSATWGLGRAREASGYYWRQARLLRDAGDSFAAAGALTNAMNVVDGITPETGDMALEAMELAVASGNRPAEAAAHRTLARLSEGSAKLQHHQASVRIGRELGDVGILLSSLPGEAWALFHENPEDAQRAFAVLDEALTLARQSGDADSLTRVASARAHMRWLVGPWDQAIADSLEMLDAVEGIRDRQLDEHARASQLARFSPMYYRLASKLLDVGGSPPPPTDVELAFSVMERLRARMLLDRLDATQSVPAPQAPADLVAARREILEELSRVQKRLLDSDLPGEERDSALRELERLELREQGLRAEIARADPEFGALRQPELPELSSVRGAIADDQALLTFQVPPVSFIRSLTVAPWLTVHTNAWTRSYALPGKEELKASVTFYLGLLGRRDGADADASVSLYRDLLEEAIRDLPPDVGRLVIVPDTPLHRLPFHTLRPGLRDKPLGSRYEVTRVPSVTAWLRFKQAGDPTTEASVLAVADPELSTSREQPGSFRSWTLANGFELGPLPHAREEARLAVRRLRGGGKLLLGERATETFVKTHDLSHYRILHFAAHALLDDDHPSRSAVVLAAGNDTEDGLLQFREVAELELDGQVVILSACQTARGTEVGGEGVMGLAHAFFQAGARAVVGSLWKLRDDESAAMADRFYRSLAKGRSVGEALTEARRDLIRGGAPVAAWAGLVAMGDTDIVLVQEGRALGIFAIFLGLAAAVAVALRIRRRLR